MHSDTCDRCNVRGAELYHYESSDGQSQYDGLALCDTCNSIEVDLEERRAAIRATIERPTPKVAVAVVTRSPEQVASEFWAIVLRTWTTWEIEGWREWANRQEQEDGA